MMSEFSKQKKILFVLIILLIAGILFSMGLGHYPIRLQDAFGIIMNKWIQIEPWWTMTQEALLLNHRLPRILIACLVGCCLSAAGASYQAAFQNPMAAPDLLGASSGAAFGAALAIYLRLGSSMILLFAFLFSLLCVGLVLGTGKSSRGNQVMSLVLAGMMISSLFSSGTSFIKLIADTNDQLPAITYWMMGSFSAASMKDVLFALVPMSAGLLCLLFIRYQLNLLTLSDDESMTMGVSTKLVRVLVVFCSTLITAASVSVSGMIGWVGLVIPHLVRKLTGSNMQYLLPSSMILGAFFLLMVDNLSRCLLMSEIPIGILTSFVGAPFFLILMIRKGDVE